MREPSQEAAPGVTLPVTRPHPGIRDGEWNEVEILLDANIMRGRLNDTGPGVSVATANDDMNAYGPIALYVGKGSEVRFKDVSYKDLAIRVQPLEKVGDRFRKQSLTPFYYNWTRGCFRFQSRRKPGSDLGSLPLLWSGLHQVARDLSRTDLQSFDRVFHLGSA